MAEQSGSRGQDVEGKSRGSQLSARLAMGREIKELKDSLESEQARVAELEAEVARLKDERRKASGDDEEAIELQAELDALSKALAALERERDELRARASEPGETVTVPTVGDVPDAIVARAEADRLQAELDAARADLDAARSELDGIRSSAGPLSEEKDRLQEYLGSTVAERDEVKAELEAERETRVKLETESDSMRREIEQLRAITESGESNQIQAAHQEALTEIERLRGELGSAFAERESLQNEVTGLRADLTQVQRQVKDATSESTKLRKSLDSAVKERDTAKSNAKGEGAQIKELKKALDAALDEGSELRKRAVSAATERDELRRQLDLGGEDQSTLATQLEEERQRRVALDDAVARMQQQMGEARDALADRERLKAELDALKHHTQRSDHEVERLAGDPDYVHGLESQIADLNRELEEQRRWKRIAEAESKRLSDQVAQMEAEVKKMRTADLQRKKRRWG